VPVSRKKGMDLRDGVSALALLAIAVAICIGSLGHLSYGSFHRPGPAFLPFWTGILIGALSVALLASSFLPGRPSSRQLSSLNLKAPLYALLVLIGYGVCLGFLGFFTCNLLFMILMVILMEGKKWFLAIGTGVITALSFYFIFSLWLQVPLPRGILF
jgi:putative tricarboxylic transport membrane protein